MSTPMEERRAATSVLVIGTGAAGLRAAIELAERGVQVLCVGKRRRDDAHTVLASGGINAALGTMDPEDSWEQHAADTLREGYWLADPAQRRAPLPRGAGGDRRPRPLGRATSPARTTGGSRSASSAPTATGARASPATTPGREIQRTLVARAAAAGRRRCATTSTSRACSSTTGRVFGAYGFDLDDGSRRLIVADAVVLAAGGHTRIWRRSSSRRDENTGDAMRLAAEAGCRLRDMELVQFHPTGMVFPEESAGTLVTEAVRGEGGILRNADGERFMERYDPERLELSTRDRVALANYTEIAEGRGTEHGGVLLDISHLDRDVILERLPRMYRQFVDLAMLDITTTPMEVAPTAHYSMGGVRVDCRDARDRRRGALRGRRVRDGRPRREPPRRQLARRVPRLRPDRRRARPRAGRPTSTSRCATAPRSTPRARRSTSARAARRRVRAPAAAGASRPDVRALRRRPLRGRPARRARAARRDRRARARRSRCAPTSPGYADLAHAFDLRGSLLAARATLECALERRETRGAHNRSDFPEQDPGCRSTSSGRSDGAVTREPIAPPSARGRRAGAGAGARDGRPPARVMPSISRQYV